MTDREDTPIKYRDLEVEAFRLGLCLTGFVLSYNDALLLFKYQKDYRKFGKNLNINNALDIRKEWVNELDDIKIKIKTNDTNIS
jgi:hypothetical protein